MKKIILVLIIFGLYYVVAQEIGAKYLIITHDNFYDAILPYAQWKHKMGLCTKIVRVPSELAQNATIIRNYIVNAYNTWQIKPEFLLIVGAPNYIPWSMTSPYSDNNYTNMNTDIYNEILSGRLTVHNITEAQTVVNKLLLYERHPDTTNTGWFINACLIVREDYEQYSDSIYWSDIRHAKRLMNENDFNIIDTLSRALGNSSSDVINRVNQGRGFVLYRGQGVGNWWNPFAVDPDQTQNSARLPIVLSITCQTIGTGSSPATAEKWLLTGTPTTPRGGAGYFATTTIVTHGANLRSAVCKGFFDALFAEKKNRFGEACENGRKRVYQMYGDQQEYRGFTTLGDPAMQLWTAKPMYINVSHDSIIYTGREDTLNITVEYQGTPVESAFVCIVLDTLIYETGYTNSNGETFFIVNPSLPGIMYITVTGRNLYPYEGTIPVITGNVHLNYISYSFNDSLGNANDTINANETILLWAKIKNIGYSPAHNVKALLKTADTTIQINDSISLYGEVIPMTEQNGLNPFVFSVSPHAHSHSIPFEIILTDAQGDTFIHNFSVPILSKEIGPVGPDPYGYYIYDDTDTLTGNAPIYEWFEIAPPGPGLVVSEITDEDADTVTYNLPFTFKFYGINYNSIGLCSNGFLELGTSTHRFGSNTAIPLPGGPKRMLAPFWDDLDLRPAPTGNGEVYYHNDTTNHRWIVEYKNCAHYGNTSTLETFQTILLDPQYYPTPTGDGEVLFFYNTVSNAGENSVGIEDETETRGLQYLFNGSYNPNAAPIQNGRALLITTKPPTSQHSPWINLTNYTINDSLGGNNNGIPEPGETIELTIYIRNGGDTIVSNVNGILNTNSMSVSLIDTIADFGDIDIGQVVNNSSNPYILQITENPADTLVGLIIHFSGNDGNYSTSAYLTLKIHSEVKIEEGSNSQSAIRNPKLEVYPNPFKNHCVIKFQIPNKSEIRIPKSEISLKIYDVSGRVVKSFNHESCILNHASGIIWSGDDDIGRRLSAGVYFIRLETSDYTELEKTVLLK
ncbi:MAG: C25 family cysteine peptidase [candidate division WOR-3 bacterium]